MEFPSPVTWIYLQTAGDSTAESNVPQKADNHEESQTVCKKMLQNIKGIIFDFDGTLFDYAYIALFLIAANPFDTFRVYAERLVRSRFAGQDFYTPENYYREFFKELGKICLSTPERMRKWYFDRYLPRMARTLKKHYKPRQGISQLLWRQSQKNSLKIAIYSDYPFLKERMEAIGLYAPEKIPLYSPDSFGALKPAVRPFLQIAEDMHLSPEEILVVGDREETDGLGAFNAKMRFFCLETGRRRYFRLDPYRRRPEDEPHGPSLLMYAGVWDGLIKLLMEK